ncbi:MAG: hypothetical protein M1828_005183 [Chrysothrix sp. TS-e1954]|nr:MAG: hypothetical protein M1828_005183 [Chrysothrix sp. TS-e1954]
MADSIQELLRPHMEGKAASSELLEQATSNYLTRLSGFSVDVLTSTEPESLDFDAQSSLRALQALSKRSYKTINTSAESLSNVQDVVPSLSSSSHAVGVSIPNLEHGANTFAEKYAKDANCPLLDRRKRATRLADKVNTLSDILELPSLLTSTIAASASTSATTGQTPLSSANANYATALDLYAHIKRLQRFYPSSELVKTILSQAEDAMRTMTTNLVTSCRTQSLKLAGALRLVGLLRRVAPELDEPAQAQKGLSSSSSEGSFGALFLVCRLFNLTANLEALEPLRELAESEHNATRKAADQLMTKSAWAAGQQSEKYLKRYIEVFREQCFAIMSMYKSIFPASLPGSSSNASSEAPSIELASIPDRTSQSQKDPQLNTPGDSMQQLPPALSTLTFDLVDRLMDTLKTFMPNVRDRSSRDSLLTQILYCAGSFGRLGGDFSMMIALLEEDMATFEEPTQGTIPEWVDVVKKHRVQASRLELLASSVGSTRHQVQSPRELVSPA